MAQTFTYSLLLTASYAVDYMVLDPCRLVCHMEHTMDECKLVSSLPDLCGNFYWLDARRSSTIVDKITEDEYVPISTGEAINILKVHKGGCEQICKSHPECVDSGSECKLSGVCLNLFWNPGTPVRNEMSTCYQRSDEGCNDGTPILCGNEPAPKRTEAVITTEVPNLADEIFEDSPSQKDPVAAKANGACNQLAIAPLLGLLVIPFFTR